MRKIIMSGLFLFATLIFINSEVYGEEKKTVWDFYKQHKHTQDFYPWGLYDIPLSRAAGELNKENLQYSLDIMAENGFNASWGHSYSFRFTKPPASKDDILFVRPRYNSPVAKNPVLSELGQWVYSELYPGREMKSLFSAQMWLRYNWPLFCKSESSPATGPFLTKEKFAAVEKRTQGVLDFIKKLGETYPDTIMGVVTDDEPPLGPGAKAAIDLIEKHTGLFATTIHPSWAGFKQWTPYMQPIGGDWYVTLNNFRKSWVIAKRLKWLNKHHPEKVFIFMPLLTRYSHDKTLPGLKDSLTSNIELRFQIWQAVALGCKGVYGWSQGGGIEWAGSGSSPLNSLIKPTNKIWGELKDLSRIIVPIGPLLLPCQSDTDFQIKVVCGKVRYPEFQGPALDYGLLRDVRKEHNRYFLIPWNNDIDKSQTGSLILPPKLLKQRKVYDLIKLKEVALTGGNQIKLTLPPGSGYIYLIASPQEYAECRNTILRHRARLPRVIAGMRKQRASAIRSFNTEEAEKLMTQAKQAESKKQWEKAAVLYNKAIDAFDKAGKKVRGLDETKQAIEQLGDILSETDELLRTHKDILELTGNTMHWHIYPNKHGGSQMRDWVTLARSYLDAQKQLTKGKIKGFGLHDRVLSLQNWAKQNRQEVEEVLDRRLKEVRKPIKVAFITPDQNQIEYYNLYTRLYKNTYADWIAPDGKGNLVYKNTCADWINPGGKNKHSGTKGKIFSPDGYDVIFIDQLLYSKLPEKGGKIDPKKVLMPEILTENMQSKINGFVENGGGLLLAGIAGLYANVLGVEKKIPEKLRENSFYPRAFAIGLAPASGFGKHPAFKGLSSEGFFTNGNHPESNLVTESAFEKSNPSGYVIANEKDDVFGKIDQYAAVVEYHKGKGKIIVFGGKAVDFTPGTAFSLPEGNRPAELLNRLILFTINTLQYLASDQKYKTGSVATQQNVEKSEKIALPLDGWLFKIDPDDKGVKQGWYKKGFDTKGWKSLRVDAPWGPQGHEGYVGPGWYRIHITASNKPGKKTMLHFAGVDEEAVVYVDGKLAGEHKEGSSGWNKPFAIDITKFLTNSPTEHLLSVRAENSAAAGGIWRPVYITYK